jgi:hypothetical protein
MGGNVWAISILKLNGKRERPVVADCSLSAIRRFGLEAVLRIAPNLTFE